MEHYSPIPYGHPAWVEINLDQFKQNLQGIKQFIGNRRICIAIKSNAYGHGLIPIGRAAVEAKVDYLAVSCLKEGAELRNAGIMIPILVLGAIHEEQIPELLSYQLEFTISSAYKAKLTAKKCQELNQKGKIHVEIDTGMQRTGVRPETGVELLDYIYSMKCFDVVGIYSHLATADRPNDTFAKQQIQAFTKFIKENVTDKNRNLICHLANSGGLCYYPESHLDMVRPGLLAFGYFPNAISPSETLGNSLQLIKPCFSVKAKIAYFKVVEAGQGISYNHRYMTSERTRIVTVPIGYGDGLRRSLSNCGQCLINGRKYQISGTICMDQFMVDIHNNEAHVGDEVTLIGQQGVEEITLDEMSRLCDTIPYEILCGFNDRLPRYYVTTAAN